MVKTKCSVILRIAHNLWKRQGLNRFILLKKYTKNHNRKNKDYIFKDFVLDSTKTGKGLAQIGGNNDRADDESVLQHYSTDTIVTLKPVGDGAKCESTGWTQWQRGREMACLNIKSISPQPHWRLPVTDRAEDLQSGLNDSAAEKWLVSISRASHRNHTEDCRWRIEMRIYRVDSKFIIWFMLRQVKKEKIDDVEKNVEFM
jgi:hypothetical protein